MNVLLQDVFFDLSVVVYSFMVQNTSKKSQKSMGGTFRWYFLCWILLRITLCDKSNSKKSKNVAFLNNWCWMSSSWYEFFPSKIRILGVVRRSCAKIHQHTSLGTTFWKNQFWMIFDFLNCGFANFRGWILIYPAEYRPIGYIFGKYTLIIPPHSKWRS